MTVAVKDLYPVRRYVEIGYEDEYVRFSEKRDGITVDVVVKNKILSGFIGYVLLLELMHRLAQWARDSFAEEEKHQKELVEYYARREEELRKKRDDVVGFYYDLHAAIERKEKALSDYKVARAYRVAFDYAVEHLERALEILEKEKERDAQEILEEEQKKE